MPVTQLLDLIEAYYDAVPRADASVEQIGPFTLFAKSPGGWPYYARPSLGALTFAKDDVERVRARQRALGIPETFEWVAETTPALAAVVEAVGLEVSKHPLMVLETPAPGGYRIPLGVEIRTATESDDFTLLRAVAQVAFGAPGTAVGSAGTDSAIAAAKQNAESVAFELHRLRTGRTITAVALSGGEPVGVGSHQPVGGVTEVVGVAVLPAFRRRGIAAALTGILIDDSLKRGIQTVFLSAGDADVARVYGRIGFREIATACAAEPVQFLC
jgi:predicted N-acetyltransferase YhbS